MVGIIHYRMGNVTSVKNALEFLGVPVMLVENPKELDQVSHIILPGVGAFHDGMKNLRELGFVDTLSRAVLEEKKPFIGLCLGMQLLASSGDEGGEAEGLNFIPGRVKHLPEKSLRIPHVGWNNARVVRKNSIISAEADFYFVHSYYFDVTDRETVVAETDYGSTFPSVVAKENIFGTQFHPEKSHVAGLDILKNFSRL